MADALALGGGFMASNISNDMTLRLYFSKAFSALTFVDLIPAVIKTIFFGFAIGFVGCYKGYNSDRGTESVGLAANSAVVSASLWIIVLDAIAVQLTSVFAYN
jgi:phospholipid/cholesterol/gamma-HCH transport system permease protein